MLRRNLPVPREAQMSAVTLKPQFYCQDKRIDLHPDALALCQQQQK
jgi:hypothetical protein